ncbi:MAG: hypothetical protein Q9182_004315 [Xanthomendoza sp. 2 TL-2023]
MLGTKTAEHQTVWNYDFKWTKDHIEADAKQPMKFSYDKLAEQALERINIISPPPSCSSPQALRNADGGKSAASKPMAQPPTRDLYALLRDHATEDEKLGRLWEEVNLIPEWVDWDQIERGQKVFYRYAVGALTGLAFQGLIGGMASNRVVETLARTGGFSTKIARHRFFETFQHVLECTKSLSDIQPGGAGHASTVRVRLLHASVRKRIMTLVESYPQYYKHQEFGTPINDLDCIQAIGTYSSNLMFLQLPRQNIHPRKQEVDDYIALFRYIAHIIGTPTEAFESPSKAKAWMESIMLTEIDPSETSKILANNIIKCLEDTPPVYVSKEFLEVGSRWLNGNDLCDGLGLGNPGYYYWALMAGQCWLSKLVAYTARAIPWLDELQIAYLRQLLYRYIVEGDTLGGPSHFDYKYVPEKGKKTTYEEDAPRPDEAKKAFSIETVYLYAFVVGIVAMTLTGGLGLKLSLNVSQSLIAILPK